MVKIAKTNRRSWSCTSLLRTPYYVYLLIMARCALSSAEPPLRRERICMVFLGFLLQFYAVYP